ncbi:MAG: hypothetical protein Kow0069_33300 [Promethearchaeota archaeon]
MGIKATRGYPFHVTRNCHGGHFMAKWSLGPAGQKRANCYAFGEAGPGDVVVVDPGYEPRVLAKHLEALGARPAAVLATHAHPDHAGALTRLARRLGAPVGFHPRAAVFVGREPDLPLVDGEVVEAGGARLLVEETPGHSPCSVCLHAPAANLAFVGDLLAKGSVGSAALPGGNLDLLLAGVRKFLDVDPRPRDGALLLPGHGPPTTAGWEKVNNPFRAAWQWGSGPGEVAAGAWRGTCAEESVVCELLSAGRRAEAGGDWERSAWAHRKVLQVRPGDPEASFRLASALASLGLPGLARPLVRRLAGDHPASRWTAAALRLLEEL